MPTDAFNYFTFNNAITRCSVPAYERMMHLWALGNTASQIVEILAQEFSDMDFNPYTFESVRKIIEQNKDEFERARKDLGIKCREEIQTQTARLFAMVKDEEDLMVEVFASKMRSALESLRALDLDELDDDLNYKNTSRIFVLTEMVIKLQSHIAKIVGTDAIREVEVYAAKARAKRESEGSAAAGLLPEQGTETVEASITWM